MILYARSRKMQEFPTPQKYPPSDIVRFFLVHLKRIKSSIQHIMTDCGEKLGKLAESSTLMAGEF